MGHRAARAATASSPDDGGRREEAAREPLISVEEELAKQLGVGIGGTLTFDVQGVPVTARVVEPAPGGLADASARTSS